MAFSAIFDVVKNILEESLPGNVHPILSLAKSDQQKNLKRKPDEHSADEDNGYYSFSKSERAAWIRQCYKKPLAAAGIRSHLIINGVPAQITKVNRPEFECEKARERRLKRQATQGVVALFNALKQHQSTVEKQLSASAPLLLQKERVLTAYTASDFLDRLSAGLPGSKSKIPKCDDSDSEPVPIKRNLNSYSYYFTMSFLKNESIFDLTGLSVTDFTLSYDSELVPAPKSSTNNGENGGPDRKEIVSPMRPAKTNSRIEEKLSETNKLELAKLAMRHDIMSHISDIVSDLVAIDMKYSELASITKPKAESRPKAPLADLVPRSDNTPLEALHNFTITELRTQLGLLKNFIDDLDAKYFEVARAVQEKITSLERVNSNLIAEVERLRKFY